MSDKESNPSLSKENVDPHTPPRSPLKVSKTGSPSHKSMWDSGDPNRNPPPLPVSPQMIRIQPNKNKNLSPNSVGKLQFATLDNSEIEHQLKRIIDAQSNLRNIVIGVDTSVKQTQLDLESLVERSSNNNSHLKDLVSNVKSSVKKESPSVTPEHIHETITKAITPIQEHNDASEQLKRAIVDRLDSLNSKVSDPRNANDEVLKDLKSSVEDLSEKLKGIKFLHTEHTSLLKGLEENVSAQLNENKKLDVSIKESKESVIESVSKIEDTIQTLGFKKFVEDHDSKHDAVLKQLESSRSITPDSFKKHIAEVKSSHESLSKNLIDNFTSSHEKHSNHINEIIELMKANQEDSPKLHRFEENLNESLKKSHAELSDSLQKLLNKLLTQSVENSKLTESLNTTLNSELRSLLSNIETKTEELTKRLENPSKDTQMQKEIENKDLTIQLKDNRIAELESELKELLKAKKLEEDIYKLSETKAKLETSCEHLNQTYTHRYSELKELSNDYDSLQQKLSNISLDKMKNILGSATVMKIANETNSLSEKVESPRKSVLANRVLSTNSYLNTNHIQLTPNSKKKYDLADDFEEKENI